MADEVLDTLALEVTTTAGGAAKGLNDLAASISSIATQVGNAIGNFNSLKTVLSEIKGITSGGAGVASFMQGTFLGDLSKALGKGTRSVSQETKKIEAAAKDLKLALNSTASTKSVREGLASIIPNLNSSDAQQQMKGAEQLISLLDQMFDKQKAVRDGMRTFPEEMAGIIGLNKTELAEIRNMGYSIRSLNSLFAGTGIQFRSSAGKNDDLERFLLTRTAGSDGTFADKLGIAMGNDTSYIGQMIHMVENTKGAFEEEMRSMAELGRGDAYAEAMGIVNKLAADLRGTDLSKETETESQSLKTLGASFAEFARNAETLHNSTSAAFTINGIREAIRNFNGERLDQGVTNIRELASALEELNKSGTGVTELLKVLPNLSRIAAATKALKASQAATGEEIPWRHERWDPEKAAEAMKAEQARMESAMPFSDEYAKEHGLKIDNSGIKEGAEAINQMREAQERQFYGLSGGNEMVKKEQQALAIADERRAVEERINELRHMTPAELAEMKAEGIREKLSAAISTGADSSKIASLTAELQKAERNAEDLKTQLISADKPAVTLRDALREAGNSIKTAFRKSIFGQFFRMAKMRAMRYAIRAIAKGIKEGVTNMYQWSKALGGDFAKSMDTGASQVLLLKNSLGTMFAPILQSLIPVLTDVVSWVNTAASSINQLFAILAGRSTWTRATLSATEYAQATKDASGSTKDLLADWDELNVIQGQSGNGNSGKKNPNYSEMFEEVDTFDENIKNLGTWLKENMDLILSVVKDIGLAIAGWKIAAGLSGFISSLGLAEEKAASVSRVLTGLRDIAIGAISLVISFKLSMAAGQEIAQEGFSAGSIIKSIGGLVAGALGGKFLVGGLFKMFGLAGGGVAGVILGITFALGVTLVSYLNTKNAKLKEQTEQFLKDNVPSYKEATLWVEYTNALIANRAQVMEKISQQLQSIGLIRDKLTLGIDVENSKARLAEQIKELVGYIGELFGVSQAMAKNEMNSGFISEETYTQYLTLNGQLFAEIQKLGDTIGGILTGAIEDSLLANGQSLLQTSLELMDQITAALHAKEDTKTQMETAREIMKETDPTKVSQIMGEKYNEMYEAAYKQMIDEYSSFVAEMKMAQIFAEAHPEDEAAQRRYQGYVALYESGEFRPSSAKADKRAKENLGNVVSELGDYLSYIFLNDKSNPYTGTTADEKSPWYTGAYQEYVKPFIKSVKTNPYLTLPSDLRDDLTDDEKFEQGYKYLSSIVENIVGKDYFDEFIASGGKLADLFSEELKQELSKNSSLDDNLSWAVSKGFDPGNGSHILRWIDMILDPELYARYKEFMANHGKETEGVVNFGEETEVSEALKETAEAVGDDVEIYMEDIVEPAIEEAAEAVKEAVKRTFIDSGATGVAGTGPLYQKGNPELATKKNSLYDALREEAAGRPSNLNFNGATSGWESTKPEPLTEALNDILNDPAAKTDFDYAVDRIRELYEVWYDGYNPAKTREGMDWNDSDAISNFMREFFPDETKRVIDENRRLSDIIDYILDYERNPREIHGLGAPAGHSVSGAAVNQGTGEMNATMAGGFASLVERLNALVPYLSNIQAATQETARKKFSVNVTPTTTLGRVVAAATQQLDRVTGNA